MIKTMHSIQEFYEYMGLRRTPVSPQFDILTHQETYPNSRKMVPVHRRLFFSIIFLENQQQGKMTINQDTHEQLQDTLFFQSPEHLFSFVRGNAMQGFLIFFQPEFLQPYAPTILSEFSFFSNLQQNLFELDTTEKTAFISLFDNLMAEKSQANIAKYLLLALLEKSKALQEKRLSIEKTSPRQHQLMASFRNLVNNHFIENKSVEFYAEKLHLTPNYLNSQIKTHTGISAKAHINDRLLLEAKNMLTYTEVDVAEIAFMLQFSDPSYFGKFFRKHTQMTPNQFRQLKQ